MGIKSLSKFLHETCPEIFEQIHISEYHFRRVAIDTSLYLCNYKAQYAEKWLGAFVKLVACLRENEIHCVFIYDSGFPPEKEAEQRERRERRAKLEQRVLRLEEAIDKYHSSGEIDNILFEFQDKRRIGHTSMLRVKSINIKGIEYAVQKLRKQLFTITSQDFETTKRLFDVLKVPYFHAPLEAETMCADLCMQGKVDAVLTEDTDVLAYGANVFLTKLNTTDGTCMRIKHSELLEKVGLSADEFLDFCIMCGTDYNKNIFRVGPSKALKLIQTHKSIDNLGMDVSILNHKRVRQLFREYKRNDGTVPYCGFPDFETLQTFLVQKNVHVDTDSLKKSFIHNVIVFEDDEEKDEEEKGEEEKGKEEEEEVIILEDD